jgi:hypothetical protein
MTYFQVLSYNPRHTEENHNNKSQESLSLGQELSQLPLEDNGRHTPIQYKDYESKRTLLFFIIVDIYSAQ